MNRFTWLLRTLYHLVVNRKRDDLFWLKWVVKGK